MKLKSATEPRPGAKPSQPETPVGRDVPAFDQDFVPRPRLIEHLNRSSAALVLLTAPAGYSKTTCLAEWAAADSRPFAWLQATPRHADPALLVASIIEALGEIEPVDPDVLSSLASPNPSISSVVLPRLRKSVRNRRRPCVLVIDDVHVLSTEAFEVIEGLLDCQPAGSQVALASRREPPLPLGRLRANRQLIELTQRELSMTRSESGELLARVGLTLTPAQVETLFERTEGWPAAIYLAGLTLLDQSDVRSAVASFAGDQRVVVDYLGDEFLAALSPARMSFLTRTAVLDELSGPLCDAVLERSGSARVLKELSRSNLLVVPLDRTDERFRYHHLFGEMLRSELHRREPEREAELHSRAGRWYETESDCDRAIEHAIAADEVTRVGELIWRAFPELSGRGRIATIRRWLDRLGHDRVASTRKLALSAAHCSLALGEGHEAAEWIRIAAASPNGQEPARDPDIRLLLATGPSEGVVQMGKDAAMASELHPPEAPWQVPCHLYRGVAGHLTGHPERAVPLLEEAARRGAIVSPVIQTLALSQLCLIATEDDDWDAALRLISQAREQVKRCGLSDYPSVLMVRATSALVRSHQGQVVPAEEDVADTHRLLSALKGFPPWYEAQARIVLARACVRLDDVAGGNAVLDDAARFLKRTPDAIVLSDWLKDVRQSLKAASSEGRREEWSLTTAELRTLQYLPSHLSFREIGERIHVSPNTVKTQAQAVYRKLEASSRAEAVEHARSAGLLGEDPLSDG